MFNLQAAHRELVLCVLPLILSVRSLKRSIVGKTACVHGSTNGTIGIPISFKVLPMVPLVIPLVPMVPLVKTDGSQYCRQSTVWAKLPTLESHVIKYGVLNFKFINFTNKHCFYQDDIRK